MDAESGKGATLALSGQFIRPLDWQAVCTGAHACYSCHCFPHDLPSLYREASKEQCTDPAGMLALGLPGSYNSCLATGVSFLGNWGNKGSQDSTALGVGAWAQPPSR